MAAFYQMLLGRGRLGNVRLLSPRLVSYVTRNHTGDRGLISKVLIERCP
jgi:hypothetical protein